MSHTNQERLYSTSACNRARRAQETSPLLLAMIILAVSSLLTTSCTTMEPQSAQGSSRHDSRSADHELVALAAQAQKKPLPPEQTEELLSTVGENWLFGQGFGETVLGVGLVVAFPPYAIYLLGNAAISYAGYEPLYITDALPEEPRQQWSTVYSSVTGVPGRISAALAGEEYRTKELARDEIKAALRAPPQEVSSLLEKSLLTRREP
jgi:hypothetical protein